MPSCRRPYFLRYHLRGFLELELYCFGFTALRHTLAKWFGFLQKLHSRGYTFSLLRDKGSLCVEMYHHSFCRVWCWRYPSFDEVVFGVFLHQNVRLIKFPATDMYVLISSRHPSMSMSFRVYFGTLKARLRILEDIPPASICCSISKSRLSSANSQFWASVGKRVWNWSNDFSWFCLVWRNL